MAFRGPARRAENSRDASRVKYELTTRSLPVWTMRVACTSSVPHQHQYCRSMFTKCHLEHRGSDLPLIQGYGNMQHCTYCANITGKGKMEYMTTLRLLATSSSRLGHLYGVKAQRLYTMCFCSPVRSLFICVSAGQREKANRGSSQPNLAVLS